MKHLHVPSGIRQLSAMLLAILAGAVPAAGKSSPLGALGRSQIEARLKSAYPDFVDRIEGNDVVFKDGGRLPFDDGQAKTFDAWLAQPDIEDMFRLSYPSGAPPGQPPVDFDPGRARNRAFFEKIYGDCRDARFSTSLTALELPPRNKARQVLWVTTINGVAEKLKQVIDELDALPQSFAPYLVPSGGAFACRNIAGTEQRSAHGYGIAVDIAVKRSDYWRWSKGLDGSLPYRNRIPREIVDVFERHGFIWGGRWYHFDTMHFEYRPELFDRAKP